MLECVCESRLFHKIYLLLSIFFLFQHINLVTTSLKVVVKFYLLALGSVNVDQNNTVQFDWSLISFLLSFIFPGYLFGHMKSINVICVLQEAGKADSRVCPRS